MAERCVQLVLHYDGTAFAGWQLQPGLRTVQGVLEETLGRLHGVPIRVTGAGRTDAGVHARGQAAGVTVAPHWEPQRLRRVMNQQLPADLWVASAHEMRPDFHARFSAVARRYRYTLGTRPEAASPFRRRWATPYEGTPLDRETLDWCAARLLGTHVFRGFAVRGTAPAEDDHRCTVTLARWVDAAPDEPGDLVFEIQANRFLHHMVRFLVATMLETASGKRTREAFLTLLVAETNDEVAPPAAPTGLSLEEVTYPADLYLPA
ncbi:MAG: tRNA pseudouridine(38-40) synthase TruA [Gemmatimonadota bacterium]|jgi:tRNA pseudouridine38-40 synthase|nr:tRNA pseudouridine(38-40) synthase TruA [Gemmatimonadota bacterium]MDQ8150005.1 tRNA pseudouridine(38-40) synthase TruA [Gemmatimonadota bacterium]MDQ8152133.1 tRNA pseudouridine(38-40) synthase TruA [Gemmatimonadota bacterium]MDQ8174251.1 tRNA pseudouridine(38-40) synthase TruA [Gemmatimonadota bacterium]MDQ8177720.1 tRNA pseudouridine(38-40) synthase TruA [Gemmatimonadota bacterium]